MQTSTTHANLVYIIFYNDKVIQQKNSTSVIPAHNKWASSIMGKIYDFAQKLRNYLRKSPAGEIDDTNSWLVFCQIFIGLHPCRASVAPATYTEQRHVIIHRSKLGVFFTVMHIFLFFLAVLLSALADRSDKTKQEIIFSYLSKIQNNLVVHIHFINSIILFIQLWWHRQFLRNKTECIMALERPFLDIGIDVSLYNRQNLRFENLWALGGFFFLVYSVAGYVVIVSNIAELNFYAFLCVLILAILPIIHKQTMLYCFWFHVLQARRNYVVLNIELVKIWELEKIKVDPEHPKWIE